MHVQAARATERTLLPRRTALRLLLLVRLPATGRLGPLSARPHRTAVLLPVSSLALARTLTLTAAPTAAPTAAFTAHRLLPPHSHDGRALPLSHLLTYVLTHVLRAPARSAQARFFTGGTRRGRPGGRGAHPSPLYAVVCACGAARPCHSLLLHGVDRCPRFGPLERRAQPDPVRPSSTRLPRMLVTPPHDHTTRWDPHPHT
jgi:hypothetical protein